MPVEGAKHLGEIGAVADREDLVVGLEEEIDAAPGIGGEAGAGAGRLENAGRGREAGRGYVSAADVVHRARGDVEGVVIRGRNVAEDGGIRRYGVLRPAGAAEQEPGLGETGGGVEEEGGDAGLTVGQAVAELSGNRN